MNGTMYQPKARAAWRPALRGKRSVQIGQASAEKLGVGGVLAPILGLTVASGAAYLGIRAGLKETGATKWIGWIVGLSGLVAVITTIGDLFYIGGIPQSDLTPPVVAQETTSAGTVQQP